MSAADLESATRVSGVGTGIAVRWVGFSSKRRESSPTPGSMTRAMAPVPHEGGRHLCFLKGPRVEKEKTR